MLPRISVIVPIYNVEKFLPKCIESLITQSYENLEIILVDDGAKDSSGTICDEYAGKDSRIKVIHKENAGVAEARNTGMANMTGEYFCFVDGDDNVHPDYVKTMYSLICEYNADIAMCAYVFKWTDGREWKTRNAEFPETHIFSHTGKDALINMLYSNIYTPSCCCKLFNRQNCIFRFPSHFIGEDMLAGVEYLLSANKVALVNKSLYYYMQHNESVMHSINPDKIYDIVKSGDEILKLIPDDDKKLQKAASFYIVQKNLSCLMKLYGLKNQTYRTTHIFNNIKKHRMNVITDNNADIITRLNCIVSFFGLKILHRIKSIVNGE
ncbi:MAG: glycosyltransferase [Clostridia bacterium]|nr:glycosyltransferase [Clostridia bacterium]